MTVAVIVDDHGNPSLGAYSEHYGALEASAKPKRSMNVTQKNTHESVARPSRTLAKVRRDLRRHSRKKSL